MRLNDRRYRKRGKTPSKPDPFVEVKCFVPRSMMIALDVEAERLGVPIERLLVRSVRRCLGVEGGFDQDLSIHVGQTQSTAEGQRDLYLFLSRAQKGLDLDLLLLAYEEAGFDSEEALKWNLADLILGGLVELGNDGPYAIPKVRVISSKRLVRKDRFKLFAGERVNQNREELLQQRKVGLIPKKPTGGVL